VDSRCQCASGRGVFVADVFREFPSTRETQESINQKIAKGKTTKDQVKAAFGEPGSTTTKPNGSEEWSYKMANSETSVIKIPGFERFFGSGTEKAKTLLVDFDRRGIVANYSLNEESK
jgi:outer membrane protein assembly factor BamE (lipoprotein component of BamABCDE complex)